MASTSSSLAQRTSAMPWARPATSRRGSTGTRSNGWAKRPTPTARRPACCSGTWTNSTSTATWDTGFLRLVPTVATSRSARGRPLRGSDSGRLRQLLHVVGDRRQGEQLLAEVVIHDRHGLVANRPDVAFAVVLDSPRQLVAQPQQMRHDHRFGWPVERTDGGHDQLVDLADQHLDAERRIAGGRVVERPQQRRNL